MFGLKTHLAGSGKPASDLMTITNGKLAVAYNGTTVYSDNTLLSVTDLNNGYSILFINHNDIHAAILIDSETGKGSLPCYQLGNGNAIKADPSALYKDNTVLDNSVSLDIKNLNIYRKTIINALKKIIRVGGYNSTMIEGFTPLEELLITISR